MEGRGKQGFFTSVHATLPHTRQTRGFFTFLLATVLLIALAGASASFMSHKPDNSYQRLAHASLQEVAVKNAVYSSLSQAATAADATAKAANAAARAAGLPPALDERREIRKALYARAILLQPELGAAGTPASLWCDFEGTRMPIESPVCARLFDVDVRTRKIHMDGIGFSVLPGGEKGVSYSVQFPDCYEVGY